MAGAEMAVVGVIEFIQQLEARSPFIVDAPSTGVVYFCHPVAQFINSRYSTMTNPQSIIIPQKSIQLPDGRWQTFDPYSRMLEARHVVLHGPVTDESASLIITSLLLLDNEAKTPINFQIMSPGGSVSAGLAIFDTILSIESPVHTEALGLAASMGAFLLAAGDPGHRYVGPNAQVMIHQPLGGAQGQASDIAIQAQQILLLRNRLNGHFADFTGKRIGQIERDCERDNYLTAEDAIEYGLADHIIAPNKARGEARKVAQAALRARHDSRDAAI